MIDVIKATEIMRKYCPETKLEIKNGADGLYLTESDIIWIGRDWHLGGLLHEITHAMLYKEDGRTGHDGVFADRLTRLVGEVFCDHISQQEKKVSLTEQWKNGELPFGCYYIKDINDETFADHYANNGFRNCFEDFFDDEIEEVLAPVPSYLQWNAMLESNDSLVQTINALKNRLVEVAEENTKLKETIKRTKANGNYPSRVSAYKSRIATLCKENAKLKELLKECRDEIAYIDYNSPVNEREQNELLTKIDEVLNVAED